MDKAEEATQPTGDPSKEDSPKAEDTGKEEKVAAEPNQNGTSAKEGEPMDADQTEIAAAVDKTDKEDLKPAADETENPASDKTEKPEDKTSEDTKPASADKADKEDTKQASGDKADKDDTKPATDDKTEKPAGETFEDAKPAAADKTTEKPSSDETTEKTSSDETTEKTTSDDKTVEPPAKKVETSSETTTATATVVTKHSCGKCRYSTRNKVLFDNHTCDNEDEDNDLEEQTLITLTLDAATKKYHCSECDFGAQGHAFEEHLMCHIILRPYQCLYCSQCFVNRREIGRHVVKQHVGKKMNCALRALKRARGLMKAALETGTYEFYARVAGKVPLASDPTKGKVRRPKEVSSGEASKTSVPSTKPEEEAKKEDPSPGKPAAADVANLSSDELMSSAVKVVETKKDSASSQETTNKDSASSQETTNKDSASSQETTEAPKTKSDDGEIKEGPVQESPDAATAAAAAAAQNGVAAEEQNPASEEAAAESNGDRDSTSETQHKTNVSAEVENAVKALDSVDASAKEVVAVEGSETPEAADGAVKESQKTEEETVADPVEDNSVKSPQEEPMQTEEEEETPGGNEIAEADSALEKKEDIVEEDMETETVVKDALETTPQPTESAADNNDNPAKAVHDGGDSANESSKKNFDQSEEEESSVGLKIVAAFSLHGNDIKEASTINDSETVPPKPAVAVETNKTETDAKKTPDNSPAVEITNPPAVVTADPPPKTLGPPSKPTPSSSFLGLSPTTGGAASAGGGGGGGAGGGQAPQSGCFFFVCGFGCSFSCLTSPEFRDHLMLDHAGENCFSCFHCGFQSHSEDGLVRHISAHAHTYSKSAPLYICGASACKFGSNLVADFITHQASWHPDLTAFHCHDCDERYNSVAELLKHFEANFLHIINCPHCTAKTTQRRTLLTHIAAVHPGKPKMVSVAKQIVCRDRKLNHYTQFMQLRNQASMVISESPPPLMIDASLPPSQDGSYEQNQNAGSSSSSSKNKSLVSILTEPIQPQERELTRQAAAASTLPPKTSTPSTTTTNTSIKREVLDVEEVDEEDCFDDSFDEEEYSRQGQGQGGGEIAYMGSKPDEREADNFKCQFCTFIARDRCRLEGHERCHGLPPSRKSRFKCMYCPQGFNNEHKFNSHVSCHPGLIKFSLFCCKRCDFDSNQRHIIVKHVRTTRDQAHMSYGSNEEDMFATLNKAMETRVLECTQPNCCYMTRHRKHLVHHIKREHSCPRKTGITVDCDIVEKYPTAGSGPVNRSKALELAMSHDRSAPLPVDDGGNVRENQARRFKCPICQYLVPRAADLKAHVKRHSEIGEITLVMFRCKYCSAASTAREIIYGHLMEKHLGKQIALVKRIVTIDTKGGDNGYAVTSMEDEEDGQIEPQSFPQVSGGMSGASGDKMVLVIPDSAGETFTTLMQCPCCAFAAYSRKTIVQHVSAQHPDVSIMGRRQDNEVYPLETNFPSATTSTTTPSTTNTTSSTSAAPSALHMTLGEALKGEILIVPDSQTFEEAVLCPKCDYATIHRRNIVQHLEHNHPGVSVMGRNDYPTFEGKGKDAVQANATGKDGMVIIGSGSLDEKIRCLYENYGDRMKCMICHTERPKKFFIHVHILRHLNILLWGCQFCSHRGLQKYKMMDHIKKVHPGRAFCIRYIPVNVEEKVNEYLQNASAIRAKRSGEEPDLPSPSKSPGASNTWSSDGDLNSMRMKYKASQDKLSSCTIGSEELDMKLACLYSIGEDSRYRCVVCAQEFQRKFAVHRHIVQAHLKINLIGCGYCDLEGVERHIMMDHIIETHKSAPISMRNLAQNLEMKVAEFLSRMTLDADAALELPASDLGLDEEDFNFKLPEPPQLPSMLPPLEGLSPGRHPLPPPARTPSPSTSSSSITYSSASSPSKNQLNPKLLLLGRDTLHGRLKCLIDESAGGLKCVVCNWDFPRKYAAHRHILMKHLKLGIIGCPYCTFEGVERYQVFTHIKEDHKDQELSLRYLDVDLEAIVATFMRNLANGTVNLNDRTPPPWSMKKVPKKEVLSDDENETPTTSSSLPSSSSSSSSSLVVAMFSKKATPLATVKDEPADGDEDSYGQEPLDREVNGDDDDYHDDGIDYDNYVGMVDENGEREVSSMSLQAANGTKAKVVTKVATDVQTNIRVITIKEKGFKRHICEKCKFTSLHRSNIVRHIYRVHEQYREQECPACNYKTLSRVLIEQHIANEHPGTPFPQGLPGRAIKRKPDMSLQDMEYDSMKKCKAAATSKRREADMPLLNSQSTQLYACAYCNFETMAHKDIVQHTRDNHTPGQAMAEDEDNGGGGGGQNGDQEEEVQEQESHREPVDTDLEVDDTEFETLTTTVKMNQVDLSKGPEDSLWQCFYCSYKTSNEDDLKVHFMEAHPGNVYRSKKIPTWRFVCRSCHVKTRAHSKMRYHLNRHINYRPYTCTTCGSFYPSPDQCRKHCRANSHNETFTYVKIPRKERRLQELLKECQEIALALTRNPGESLPPSSSAPPLAYSIPSKRKAKKSFTQVSSSSSANAPTPPKLRKTYEYDAPYSPRRGGRGEDKKKDDDIQMVCACCDFTAGNVCDVWLHFIKEHETQEFMWMDASTGHICTETGEITNAKDIPPDLEAPPGPGYSTMSNRMLSCHYCEFTTSTVQAMKSHLRRHLPKRYLCPYCSLRCSRRDTITQHVRCGHRGRELWTIFFRLPDGFVPDVDEAEGVTDLAEPQVTFQTSDDGTGESPTPSPVKVKVAPVSATERIKCGHCDMRLESVASVHEHHSQDHPDGEFLWIDSTNGYTCTQTGEVLDARDKSPHLFSQDGFRVESSSGNVPVFSCKFCSFTSAFIQAIKSHMKSHLPHGFMCPYCCMCTNSKEKMMSHQSCTHREQEPWVLHLRMPTESPAPSSSSASSSMSSAEKNMALIPPALMRQQQQHKQTTGVTVYSCSECDFTSENMYQYRRHLARHGTFPHLVKGQSVTPLPDPNTAENNYSSSNDNNDLDLYRCGYCAYVASDEGDFGAHIASHLERRGFRCGKCDFEAFTRSAVESHIQSTHDETEEIQVVDLNAKAVVKEGDEGEEGLGEENPQLVNLEPKLKVKPVDDCDLDREGLVLFSPPLSPEGGGGGGGGSYASSQRPDGCFSLDSEDVGIIGLSLPSATDLDLDNQSDSTEEWGEEEERSRLEEVEEEEEGEGVEEGSPVDAAGGEEEGGGGGGSILRLTLQGKLTGEYGIKRAVPADRDSEDPEEDSQGGGGEEEGEGEGGEALTTQNTEEFEPRAEEEEVNGNAVMEEEEEGVEEEEMEETEIGDEGLDTPELVEEGEEESRGKGGDVGNVFATLNSWLDA